MENVLSILTWLACPIGMGLLMWLMMGTNRRQGIGSMQMPDDARAGRPAAEASPGDRLGQLRTQLGEVRAQQAAIAVQIDRLSAEDQPAEPRDAARPVPTEPAERPISGPVSEGDAAPRSRWRTAGRWIQHGGSSARQDSGNHGRSAG